MKEMSVSKNLLFLFDVDKVQPPTGSFRVSYINVSEIIEKWGSSMFSPRCLDRRCCKTLKEPLKEKEEDKGLSQVFAITIAPRAVVQVL